MIKALVFDAYGTLFDVMSVARETEAAFPGRGEVVTQIWRLKQLEYSWLRSLMERYADFRAVTAEALVYALETLGLPREEDVAMRLLEAYDRLDPYPEAADALAALSGYRLAILSNGSPAMLDALVRNGGLAGRFEAVLSVDAKRVYKPAPAAYALVEERLGVRPDEVLFVSSNGFDVGGAKSFGFQVARIDRLGNRAFQTEIGASDPIGPATLYKALRARPERLGHLADVTISSLSELADITQNRRPA